MADTRFVQDYPALVRHREQMANAGRDRRRRLILGGTVIAVLVGASWTFSPPLAFILAGIGAGVLFFAAMPQPSSVGSDELSGIEGEVRVLGKLRGLPDDTVIINRLRIPDRQLPNGSRELDFVLIDDERITIVEVKNTPGLIYVDPDKRQWPLTRRAGCGSRPSWNALDNPIPQVRAQASALERWLLERGVVASPRPVVCFGHFEVAIENANASPVPVVTAETLIDHLGDERTGRADARHDNQRLVELLSALASPTSAKVTSHAA